VTGDLDPVDVCHKRALLALDRPLRSRDKTALAQWRRELASLIRDAANLSPENREVLAWLAEKGPRFVAGRKAREVDYLILVSLRFGHLSMEQASRIEALLARGKRDGEPSDADKAAARQAIYRAMKKKGWRVGRRVAEGGGGWLWGPNGSCADWLLSHLTTKPAHDL
jgi:hypothetical protein